MSNKQDREDKEIQNLLNDPRYVRKMFQSIGQAIAQRPASAPICITDKDGNETSNSQMERYTFDSLKHDISILTRDDKQPTELEMIMACQIVKARTDTNAATFIRDTLGAKPVDESKLQANVTNVYEQLTDEELELLASHRKEQALVAAEAQADEQAMSHRPSLDERTGPDDSSTTPTSYAQSLVESNATD